MQKKVSSQVARMEEQLSLYLPAIFWMSSQAITRSRRQSESSWTLSVKSSQSFSSFDQCERGVKTQR
jgi:hypothetical protein